MACLTAQARAIYVPLMANSLTMAPKTARHGSFGAERLRLLSINGTITARVGSFASHSFGLKKSWRKRYTNTMLFITAAGAPIQFKRHPMSSKRIDTVSLLLAATVSNMAHRKAITRSMLPFRLASQMETMSWAGSGSGERVEQRSSETSHRSQNRGVILATIGHVRSFASKVGIHFPPLTNLSSKMT